MRLPALMASWRGRVPLGTRTASTSTADETAGGADVEEIARFARLSREWHAEEGAFRALHSMNTLRVPWIADQVLKRHDAKHNQSGMTKMLKGSWSKKAPPSVLEVGCGGGLLAVPLARRGLQLLGVDACAESIAAAEETKNWSSMEPEVRERLQFQRISVRETAQNKPEAFDAVVASEVVEHVQDVRKFISDCARTVKPGAPLFFTTINRTLASRIGAIWIAEDILGIVPPGMHEYEKFVTCEELSEYLESSGCSVRGIFGMAYNPLENVWKWSSCTIVNYALMAEKNRSDL